jgi:hypothetical protein
MAREAAMALPMVRATVRTPPTAMEAAMAAVIRSAKVRVERSPSLRMQERERTVQTARAARTAAMGTMSKKVRTLVPPSPGPVLRRALAGVQKREARAAARVQSRSEDETEKEEDEEEEEGGEEEEEGGEEEGEGEEEGVERDDGQRRRPGEAASQCGGGEPWIA